MKKTNKVYIVLKDYVEWSLCGTHRTISEFSIADTTLDLELKNCKKISPKKIDVDRTHNKLTLYV